MSKQMVQSLIDFAVTYKLKEVVWIGGEPSLYDMAFISKMSKRLLEGGVKIVRLNTNAYDITPILKYLHPNNISFINVSIDDLPSKTLVRDKKIWESCKILLSMGYSLRVNVTISKLNKQYIEKILTLINEELNPLEINIHGVSLAGNARKNNVELAPLEYLRVWKRLKRLYFYHKISGPIIYKHKNDVSENDLICVARNPLRLYVIPDGSAFSCPYLVLDASRKIISRFFWNGKGFRERKQYTERYMEQKGCPIHSMYSQYNIPKNYITLCRYVKNNQSRLSVC